VDHALEAIQHHRDDGLARRVIADQRSPGCYCCIETDSREYIVDSRFRYILNGPLRPEDNSPARACFIPEYGFRSDSRKQPMENGRFEFFTARTPLVKHVPRFAVGHAEIDRFSDLHTLDGLPARGIHVRTQLVLLRHVHLLEAGTFGL
jgi:hypothetical protein